MCDSSCEPIITCECLTKRVKFSIHFNSSILLEALSEITFTYLFIYFFSFCHKVVILDVGGGVDCGRPQILAMSNM